MTLPRGRLGNQAAGCAAAGASPGARAPARSAACLAGCLGAGSRTRRLREECARHAELAKFQERLLAIVGEAKGRDGTKQADDAWLDGELEDRERKAVPDFLAESYEPEFRPGRVGRVEGGKG